MAESGNYAKIVADNLRRRYENVAADLCVRLGAAQEGDRFSFPAFGRQCIVSPGEIRLDGRSENGVLGVLISLYALSARPEPCTVEPLVGFKELPDNMPYAGAFAARTQQVLVPHVDRIEANRDRIRNALSGTPAPPSARGDFSFLLHPLPKIALCYVFYRADEDFPPSVTCLFSANASSHLPTDGLADVGEYTSRAMLELIGR